MFAKIWLISESIGVSGSILNIVIFPETANTILSGMLFGSIIVLLVGAIIWGAITRTD